MPAIVAQSLTKEYMIGGRQRGLENFREMLHRCVSAPFRRHPRQEGRAAGKLHFLALKNVSFEVGRGEAVGVIGRNGAGKSTLLKILSRITEPTSGRAEIRGRVGSLLEVGTGFHPELTGRENVYLNGAILGMSQSEIRKKFDDIVAFSGIDRFLDTPVKRYSSGMYVRLAFAVAAHLEPEILIVDEVLAVGDAQFQRKCLGKMGDVTREGRTVLFVSHNMHAISTLTSRCLLLEQGECIYDGPTDGAINEYLRHCDGSGPVYEDTPLPDVPRVTRVDLCTSEPGNVHLHGEPMEIRFDVTTPEPIEDGALAIQVFNHLQMPMLHFLVLDSDLPLFREAGRHRLVCRIPKVRLYIGQYNLTVHLAGAQGRQKLQTIEGICTFDVVAYGKAREGYWKPGTCSYVEEYDWVIEEVVPVDR